MKAYLTTTGTLSGHLRLARLTLLPFAAFGTLTTLLAWLVPLSTFLAFRLLRATPR